MDQENRTVPAVRFLSRVRLVAALACAAVGSVTGVVAQGMYFDGASVRVTQSYEMSPGASQREAPFPSRFPLPEYPIELLRQGFAGSAVVECTVLADGRVTNIKVRESTREEFARAAQDAVGKWNFRALADAGADRAASVPLTCRFRFDLNVED